MSYRRSTLYVWLAVIVAYWLASNVIPISGAEACALGGGDWNEAWSRCYP